MLAYFVGSMAGRLATVLCAILIALPYGLRRRRAGSSFYVRRLWPHFWTGYAVAALTVVHAGLVMGAMGRANGFGIWASTVAFFLMVLEIVVGLSLREEQTLARKALRRLHFWVMTGFVASLGVHLLLNG